jgi:hypothetical protein
VKIIWVSFSIVLKRRLPAGVDGLSHVNTLCTIPLQHR